MKPILPALIFAAVLCAAPAARAVSPAQMRVEQVNKNETEKFKKTQKRSLKVTITNSSAQDLNLKVKFTIFGREAKGHDIVVVSEGEQAATVKAHGTEVVNTATASAVFEDEHYDKKKKIEASGSKLVGQAVQLFDGDKMIAEAYEPLSMKESLAKIAGAAKGDTVKRK